MTQTVDNNNTPKWYIIHVFSTHEQKVKKSLELLIENNHYEDKIFEIAIPTREEMVKKESGKQKVVEKKEFPGYVFIKMIYDWNKDRELGYFILNTRGVTGFVGPEGRPQALSDDEVKRMGLEKVEIESYDFNVGDNVKIIRGPFEGNIGTIREVNQAKGRAKITMQLLGRETSIDFEFDKIEKTTLKPEDMQDNN